MSVLDPNARDGGAPHPHRTIPELLRTHARERPERPALVDATGRFSWAELDTAVTRAAVALRRAGLEPGDRVALRLRTSSELAVLYLGALRAGLVAVPVNPASTERETEHILADSGARLCLTSESAGPLLAGAPADAVDPHADRPDEALAVLLYTSGTSGTPRGAMLSHRALVANLDQLAAVEPPLISAADVLFVPLPLTHVFGLNAGLGMALRVGATAVLAGRFDPAATLASMAAEGVTAVAAVPGQYAAWLRRPEVAAGFARVRFAMSGSATLARGVVAGYAALGVTVHDGYGLTEAAPVVAISALGASREQPKPGSVGRPLPGVEVQLRDVDGTVIGEVDDDGTDDDDASGGDPGRIFVRGANLFSGYWPDGGGGPDPGGWFGTGDIAVRDSDGELHLVGRSAELVIVNGFNVYPAEVEAVLAAQPGVAEVAVVGVPDERTGEAVHAYVVPAAGAAPSPDELLAAAGRALARFKLPSVLAVVPELPHTVTGKVMKWALGTDPADGSGDGGG